MGGIAQGFGKLAGSILGVKSPKVPAVTKPPGSEDPTQGSLLIDDASLQALQAQAERRSLAQSTNRSLSGTGDQRVQDTLLTDVAGTQQSLTNQANELTTQIATQKKTDAQRAAAESEAMKRRWALANLSNRRRSI